jgi:hypothetical protein
MAVNMSIGMDLGGAAAAQYSIHLRPAVLMLLPPAIATIAVV